MEFESFNIQNLVKDDLLPTNKSTNVPVMPVVGGACIKHTTTIAQLRLLKRPRKAKCGPTLATLMDAVTTALLLVVCKV